ncbi:hypothetical protein LTS17_012191 [Exophiala oligosperma]
MDISGYALVTGAGSGIGRATAIEFARAGAKGIALFDLNGSSLDRLRTELESLIQSGGKPCRILTKVVDVSNEDTVTLAVNEIADCFGRVDYVVNAAGIAFKHADGSAEAETKDWHRVMDINLNGTFYVYRAAAKLMLKQDYLVSTVDGRPLQRGVVVNVSSICGVHAVIGLTRTASEDYAGRGLRINAVCPGYIDTPLIQPGTVVAAVAKEKTEQWTPLRRFGTASEVADAIVFLSSGRSSYITGTALMVDGGYTSH